MSFSSTMAFLHEHAIDPQHILSPSDRDLTRTALHALANADAIIIQLGGKAGRIGESIVATGLLETLLLALSSIGKANTPVSVLVDETVYDLFDAPLYHEHYWSQISIISVPLATSTNIIEAVMQQTPDKHILVLDLHSAHDGMPSLQIEEYHTPQGPYYVTTLAHLFRVGIRSYAYRGSLRRYADFIEDLFALPAASIDGWQAQPRLLLSNENMARYPLLAHTYGLRSEAILVVCFFQSVVPAKCYGRWEEVMTSFCQAVAQHLPQQQIDFLLACGPDEQLPDGVKKADIREGFEHFTGVQQNARIIIQTTPSLRDLTILLKHATLTFSNDTGPGHISGALQVPTITPYLPGNLYSKRVWSSTLWHHGVTLEPSPFSFEQLRDAVLWDNQEIINSVPPEELAKGALEMLQSSLLQMV
ncbi:MAG TPA: glycosyltransferase family 9 protein [Ktedonosporobacter sp.]|nr:glycosyltransferase family 9 protein [Ktedonosporobacter sp.]